MASFNDIGSLSTQPILSGELPLLDLFFPGFAPLTTAVLRLLTGDLNLYARLLYIYGALMFIVKYAPEYL